MKNFYKGGLSALAVLAVFTVSFAAGRMTAIKSSDEQSREIKEQAERAVAVMPLLRAAETPLSEETEETVSISRPKEEEDKTVRSVPKEEAIEDDEPPFPLLKPVEGEIMAEYSLSGVYSETMKDWRAHTGMDIEAPLTSQVKAAADGEVTRVYEDKLWGNVIEISHKGGLKTVYKGVSTLSMVSEGKKVAEGDVISGIGTAPSESKAMPHLHFEVIKDGLNINPSSYVID